MTKSPFSPIWICVASLALPFELPIANATSLYWDGSSSGPDAEGGVGTWITDLAIINWDTSASGGTDVPWTNGSDAIFAGIGGLVTVSGTVNATSLSFQSASYSLNGGNVALTGAPAIDVAGNDVIMGSVVSGSAPISKTGTGMLTLSGPNTFSGTLAIDAGTVKTGSTTALGATGTQNGTTVSAGATLELNGLSLGLERVTFSGNGVGGAGAIVNNGPTGTGAVRNATLAGPATLGGTKRWNIGSSVSALTMGGHTLTKTGSGDIHLLGGVTTPGNIDVKEGSFWLEFPSSVTGTAANVVTVRSGALLGQASNNSNTHPWTASFETSTIWRISTNNSRWDGPVTLAGNTAFDVVDSTAMSHFGVISGSGSATKDGTGIWTLNSLSTFSGGTQVNTGKMILNAVNSTSGIGTLRGAVTVNNDGILELAKPGVFGSPSGPRVSPLNINGGLVDNTSAGGNSIDKLNLVGGTLRSGTGVNSPAALSYFTVSGGSLISGLAAEISSLISGRLDLGSGATTASTEFHVDSGNATEDLRIDAAITENTTGHGIIKSGSGLMALNGPCLFTGNTTVQAGTLEVVSGGSLSQSPVTVKQGGRFGTSAAGKSLASLVANGGSTLLLPARDDSTMTVAGTLELTDSTISISPILGAHAVAGTYDLITAEDIIGVGTPALDLSGSFGPTRAFGSVAVNGNKLQLILSGTGGDLVWSNASAGGSSVGTWDNALGNFSIGGSNGVFQAFDSVTFNDSVTPGTAKNIALGTTLAPALLTVDNSNGAYTFFSNGGLAGAGSLVKTGSSSLTIGGMDSYAMTGDITAGGGMLDFSGKALSISGLTITGGGEFSNATATINSAKFQSGRASATLIGATSWTKTTGGTVELAANNRLSGAGFVTEGSLLVGNSSSPNAMGALGTGSVDISGSGSVTFSRGDTAEFANTFSGTGTLNFVGTNNGSNGASDFKLLADNRGFSGPLTITNGRLQVITGKELGSSDVTLAGKSSLFVENQVVPNTLHTFTSGEWAYSNGSSVGNLMLSNATYSGPIYLTGSTSTLIRSTKYLYADSGIVNTISGPIQESGGSASLILVCDGLAGTVLTLSGTSSYTGTTTIIGEAVSLTGSLGATAVTVESYSELRGTGFIGAGGSLTFKNKAILRIKPTGGVLTVYGNVDLGPALKVGFDGWMYPAPGVPIPVLNYTGTLSGSAAELSMADYSFPYRQTVFAITPGHITLDIGSKTLIWKGASGSTWAVGGTKLWNTTGSGETESFYHGDSVRFDDTGSGTVSSLDPMLPSAVVFDNSSKNYGVWAQIFGSCALTKRGTGNLKMVADNTYTGGTIVEAGRLEAQLNSLGTGPVTVAAGATLAGDAGIPGPVTIAGTVDPGNSGSTGSSTLSLGPTILTGNYVCQLSTYSNDGLAVTGDLDITGSMLTLNKTYYSTYRTATIATYTGSLTGRFGSVIGMPSGFVLRYDTVGKRIIVRPITFDIWVEELPTLADPTPGGDPDGDGIPSLVEYVLGGNPSISDRSILPTYEINGSNLIFRFKRLDWSISGTSQVVQWASDLGQWNNIPVTSSNSPNVHVLSNDDQPDDITVTIPRVAGQMFVRLQITSL